MFSFVRWCSVKHKDGLITCYENNKCICEFEVCPMVDWETLSHARWTITKTSKNECLVIMKHDEIFGGNKGIRVSLLHESTCEFNVLNEFPRTLLKLVCVLVGLFVLTWAINV